MSVLHEWFRLYQQIDNEIVFYEFNLERTKRELQRWVSGDLAKFKLTAESDGAKLEELIEGMEYELAHKMNDVFDIKRKMKTFEGLEYDILYMKYVDGMTLERIAEELQYSAQYIYNKHAQIKRKIEYAQSVNH